MRRLILAAAVVSLTATGCGGSAAHHQATATAAQVHWADQVCGSVGAAGTKLQLPVLNSKNSKNSQKSITVFLAHIATELTAMQASLNTAGAPPVDNGRLAVANAVANLKNTEQAVEQAAASLSSAKVTDAASLRRALGGAGSAMSRYSSYQGPAHDLRANPDLNRAFDQSAVCKANQL